MRYVLALALLAMAPALAGQDVTDVVEPTEAQTIHDLRVKKCELIVQTFYNHAGRASFLPHCEYLIDCHEGLEAEGVRKRGLGREGYERAKGYGAAWWWSACYGGANFSLRCYATAPGSCAGPMDVKRAPLVLDPHKNILWHCEEMWGAYKRGVRGRDLCEYVMLPANPWDWGGGMFRKTDRKHRALIAKAYREGWLP